MFRKVLSLARIEPRVSPREALLTLGNQFGFCSTINRREASIKKRRALEKENLVTQDVKKALMSADQNVIVMVRG